MNRITIATCVAAAISATCLAQTAATSQTATTSAPADGSNAVITKSGVYVRTGPDTGSPVVAKAAKDQRVEVVGWSGDYWAIKPLDGCQFAVDVQSVQVTNARGKVSASSGEAVIYAVSSFGVPASSDPKVLPIDRVPKGTTLVQKGSLGDKWFLIEPPAQVVFYVAMNCVSGDPLPMPAKWDGLGAGTPEALLKRVADAVNKGDEKELAACLDPAGILAVDVAGLMLQNTRLLLLLQEKAAKSLGNDAEWDLTSGLLGMMTMVDARWFDKADIAVSGDTAKASHDTLGNDGTKEKKSVSLVRRSGKWFIGATEKPDRVKAGLSLVVMRKVTTIIEGAQQKLTEQGMTMKQLHLWCRDQLLEAMKSGAISN
jgi:hypothetical protein